jgi:DNA-binding CsgD family transcriptional regulator
MSIFRRLQRLRIGQRRNDKNSYALDEPLPSLLTNDTAIKGNRENTAPPVSANGFPYQGSQNDFASLWRSLSPREKDVTALTCLRYTDRQIASKLGISVPTVRTYIGKAVIRFGIQTKADLRVLLANIDFSTWEDPPLD